eukprot:CAMPEP_0170537882 /NCGR_PEP_ID=MMETSP0209-20121228/102982_1 /TAXON_ID=665100 ORGANISM="Litonotus pictus, Strain P1" /NCGR_SAMPLE_ID=MMETSP0209 /ASSEMBLY_ACC=CAM_ASM_000301 /LENGTH=861 /DNA_ID=CAMNT_0010839471 /DNA_START=918 /DNA_END=3500 /DNA_ORIENTATION=+
MTVNYNWTFDMAEKPLDGIITVMPNAGFKNTTYFIWSCEGWKSDTEDGWLDYKMVYSEENTNKEIELKTWTNTSMIENDVVIQPTFFSGEYVNVTFICYARDSNNAISNVTKTVKVVNDVNSPEFTVNKALDDYFAFPLTYSDYRAFLKSEFLFSLVQEPPKTLQPPTILTTVQPSPDNTQFVVEDPICIKDFCNGNGDCVIIDVLMLCNCNSGFIGIRCQVEKESYTSLNKAYNELYDEVVSNLGSNITTQKIQTLTNVVSGAAEFEQDNELFKTKFSDFMAILKSGDKQSTIDNVKLINQMLDKIITYEFENMNKIKAVNKNLTQYQFRNITLNTAQQPLVKEAIFSAMEKLNNFIDHFVKIHAGNQLEYTYEGLYYEYSLNYLTPAFSATSAFDKRIKNYFPWVDPLKCITAFELGSRNNPFFTNVLSVVDYKIFPFAFDEKVYNDSVTPFMEIKVYDSSSGGELNINDCFGDPINIYMPCKTYGYYLDEINRQKVLYNSSNYLSPDSPVFKDPIYINETGFISNDTIGQRIERYKRNINLTCKYYDPLTEKFTNSGITYDTLTDSQYFRFNSSHLTGFGTFTYPNEVTFTVDGPFFYIPRTEILTYMPNYTSNYAFFCFITIMSYYFLVLLLSIFWDYKYFQQEVLLKFLTKQIIENQMAYHQRANEEDDLPKNNVYDNVNNNIEDKTGRSGPINIADNTAPPVRADFSSNTNNPFNQKSLSPLEMDMVHDVDEMKHKLDGGDKPFVNPSELMNLDNIDDFHLDNLSINDKEDVFGANNGSINVPNRKINNLIFGSDKAFDGLSNNPVLNADILQINELELKKLEDGPKETDDEEEAERRLRAFSDINLSACQFFCW